MKKHHTSVVFRTCTSSGFLASSAQAARAAADGAGAAGPPDPGPAAAGDARRAEQVPRRGGLS